MSSISVLHQSARPADGETHDVLTSRIHKSNRDIEVRDRQSRGWALAHEEPVWIEKPMPGGIGGVPTDFMALTFARSKYPIGTDLMWHRPTQEPESPIQVLPCKVMGQFADGPYQLFVFSFQGGHIQMAPPEQIEPMPDRAGEFIQQIARTYKQIQTDLSALRESYDVKIAGLMSKVADLEAAVTAPHKGGRKDEKPS